MSEELARRIWEWLPARTDSRRVTLPYTIATALDVDVRAVQMALDVMERTGNVVRNRVTGRQSGWHRGAPLEPPSPAPLADQASLF